MQYDGYRNFVFGTSENGYQGRVFKDIAKDLQHQKKHIETMSHFGQERSQNKQKIGMMISQ
jgi:hypothetical protein